MAPNPSAVDGNLRLLKKMASKIDLREAKDSIGGNVLHYAAAMGHLEICRFLVEESGLDVNCTTAGGTPISHAAEAGKVSVLRYLLDHGGDPGMRDAIGSTPLHDAAYRGHDGTVRLLLYWGVDVDPANHRDARPLGMAAGEGHDQAVKILLEYGADPNKVANNMFSPLMLATYAGSLKCIKLLVEAGADVNFESPYEATSPLLKAVLDGSIDIVKFLLDVGANPNTPDMFGEIPIMHAARKERRDLVEVIFPYTKPIASLPNWSVGGIITTIKHTPSNAKIEEVAADVKLRGNEAFAKGDYLGAIYLYGTVNAMAMDPLDATLFCNRSLCSLRLGNGEQALLDAQKCKMMRPRWPKAWYCEGAAFSLLKNYKGAANAFVEALNLDPANDEIKTALREAIEALGCTARPEEHNP